MSKTNQGITLPYCQHSQNIAEHFRDEPFTIFLDSCHDRRQQGGKDIICARPMQVLTARGSHYQLHDSTHKLLDEGDNALEKLLELEKQQNQNLLGYFGYHCNDAAFHLQRDQGDEDNMPDICLGFYPWRIEIDHGRQKATLFFSVECPQADIEEIQSLFSQTHTAPETPALNKVHTQSNFSKNTYQQAFAKVKHYIRQGDCYQVNLAQGFSGSCDVNSWDYYCFLRTQSPAPFAAFFTTPYGDVLSFSPECFLTIDEQGKITSQPIKGTRKRQDDSIHDQGREELANSSKDQAENLMIVDLIRNDISKNAELNSVKVDKLFEIHSFANVHHMISSISAQMLASSSPLQVLLDCFPGGSITGAPKKRAMEIIAELEPHSRQVYCGAIGYLNSDRQMSFNIAIRTLIIREGMLYCWGGGGLVADSDMEAEYQESINKVSNLIDIDLSS